MLGIFDALAGLFQVPGYGGLDLTFLLLFLGFSLLAGRPRARTVVTAGSALVAALLGVFLLSEIYGEIKDGPGKTSVAGWDLVLSRAN